MPRPVRPCLPCGLLACVAAGAAAPAAASPLGDPTTERAVFLGATASQPDALVLNPAALTLGPHGVVFHAGLAATVGRVWIDRRTMDPETGALGDGPPVAATTWSPGGTIGIYGVGDGIAGGIQITAPPGVAWVDGGDALGYHARGGHHREYTLAAGGGLRWDGIAVGATFRLATTDVTLRYDRDTALEAGRDPERGTTSACDGAPCGFEHPAARERYEVGASTSFVPGGQQVAVSFGAALRIVEGWWLGIAYHLPQGTFARVEATGTVTVERAPRDGGGAAHGEAVLRFSPPHRLRAGVRGRIVPALDLVGELRWERLGSFQRYDVRALGLALTDAGVPEIQTRPLGLRDQVALQLGVEQVDTGQTWLAGARLGLERGATSAARLSPLAVEPTSVTLDLGVHARLGPSWIVTVGAGVRAAPPVDTGRGAYDPIDRLDRVDSGLDLDTPACRAVAAGGGLPTASGVYARVDGAVRVVARFVFR